MASARAQSEAEAASLALGHLGLGAIADLADANARARAARLFFGGARDALLREKWWSFAKSWVRPAADTVASLGPLTTRYPLPGDCLRVRYIDGVDDAAWDIEGGQVDNAGVQVEAVILVTGVSAPLVAYTRRVEDVRLWDGVFLEGFGFELASKMARRLGRSQRTATDLHARAMDEIESAAAIDSKEQSRQTVTRTPSIIAARRGFRSL